MLEAIRQVFLTYFDDFIIKAKLLHSILADFVIKLRDYFATKE